MNGVKSLSHDMIPLTPNQLRGVSLGALHAKHLFSHLPFCNLVRAAKNRVGCLRAWPKWRSVQKILPHCSIPNSMMMYVPYQILEKLREAIPLENTNPGSDQWEQFLTWRPLVSYRGNRWARLFAFGGAYCTFVIDFLNLGFHRSGPRRITEEVHRFNRGARPKDELQWVMDGAEVGSHRMKILDLMKFFPSCPASEFIEILQEVHLWVLERNPNLRFF